MLKLAAPILTIPLAAGAAELTIERADPAFFEITVAELRFSPEQPRINVQETARTIRQVLRQLGLNVHDYDMHLYDEYGIPFEVDVSPVAEEQREQSKSGPVLHYFRKNVQHIPGFGYEDGYRQDRGEIILGVTSEWPSGKHHGSVTSCTHVDTWQEEREEQWMAGSSAVPVPDSNWTVTHDDTLK